MKKSLLWLLVIASIIPMTTIKIEALVYRPETYDVIDAFVERKQIDWNALFAALDTMSDTIVNEYRTKTGFSLVHRAVMVKNLAALKTLLEKYNATPNVQAVTLGNTPLMQACSLGEFDITKLLLMYGADPYIQDVHRHDAFYHARNHPKILNLLKQYKR